MPTGHLMIFTELFIPSGYLSVASHLRSKLEATFAGGLFGQTRLQPLTYPVVCRDRYVFRN